MDTVAILLIAVVTMLLLCFTVLWKRDRKTNHYKLPNGPRGLPLIGNLLGMVVNPHLKLSEWAEKHGKLFTIYFGNQPAIVINDAKTLREIFSKASSTGKFKTDTVLLVSRGPNGIVNTEGNVAVELRAFLMKSFKGFGTRYLESIMLDEIHQAMNLFSTDARRNRRTIPYKVFHCAIASSFYTLVNGKRLCDADGYNNKSSERMIQILDNFLEWLQYTVKSGLCFAPWLKYVAPKWSGFLSFDKACQDLHDMFEVLFVENKESYVSGSNPRHFIDCYLEHLEIMKNNNSSAFHGKWGYVNSVTSISEIFVAGVNTTAITLDWIVLYLSWNPIVQTKLKQEIDEVIGQERAPSFDYKSRMPYTEAVILEGHRCASAIPLGIIHELLEDTSFHGYYFPKRLKLVANTYHIHNDKHVWGDPENFRPERFLESGKSILKENVVPFQVGRRSCPGEPVAQDFIFLMLTSFFQKFSVLPDPTIPKEKYFKSDVGLALKAPDLGLLITERKM